MVVLRTGMTALMARRVSASRGGQGEEVEKSVSSAFVYTAAACPASVDEEYERWRNMCSPVPRCCVAYAVAATMPALLPATRLPTRRLRYPPCPVMHHVAGEGRHQRGNGPPGQAGRGGVWACGSPRRGESTGRVAAWEGSMGGR